jgi:hypothetical protein
MKYVAYVIIILLLIGLSFGVIVPLGVGWLVPSLLLLVTLCIVLEYGSLDFLWFALVGGIWLELFYGLPVGSFAGAYLLIGLSGYVLSQRLLLADGTWRYYFVGVIIGEGVLLLWLWAYTGLLHGVNWSAFAVSGTQLWRHWWAAMLIALIFSLPVYGIITGAVRWINRKLRQPLKLR